MLIKESRMEDILYNIHRDVPDLDFKRGIDAYHSVKRYPHKLELNLRNIELYSEKDANKDTLRLCSDNQIVVFTRKHEPIYKIMLQGKGAIVDSVVETCAGYEMQKIKHDIYLLENANLFKAKPHLNGYLLKNTENGDTYKYLSAKKMYELYATAPHTILEEKLIILKEGRNEYQI